MSISHQCNQVRKHAPSVVNTMFLLLLAYMVTACIGCGWRGKGRGLDQGQESSGESYRIPEEIMNSFPNPRTIEHQFNGNSSPIDITPFEGMRIKAARNAFVRETNIRVSEVSDAEFEAIDQKFNEAHIETLLAYHIDAGLGDHEVMPGVFRVEMDLNELGIPEEIWGNLKCYREGNDGSVTELASWVKDGKLCYESAQNSAFVVGVIKWFGTWFAKAVGVKVGIYTAIVVPAYYGIFYFVRKTGMPTMPKASTLCVHVTDPEYGSFKIHYDQQDSEHSHASPFDKNGNSKMEKIIQRYKELEAAAEKEYERSVNAAVNTKDSRGIGRWQTSEYQKDMACKRISKEVVLDQLAQKDEKLQELINDDFYRTPESINILVEREALALRYLCGKQGLCKTWYCFDLFIADDPFMNNKGYDVQAYALAYDGFFTFLCARYSKILERKGKKFTIIENNINEMTVVLCHETFHLKQYQYMASTTLTKDDRFCEATAVILEEQFADYLESCGLSDPKRRSDLALTSTEGRGWLAWTLEKPVPANSKDGDNYIQSLVGSASQINCDIGYMLGEFLQYLFNNHLLNNDKEMTLKYMLENYEGSLGFHGMMMKFFNLSETQFQVAFEDYCKTFMDLIVKDQTSMKDNEAMARGLLDNPVTISPRYCVHRIRNFAMNLNGNSTFNNYQAWAYGIKVFQFVPHKSCDTLKYHVFAVPSPAIDQTMLKTIVLNKNYEYKDETPRVAVAKDDNKPQIVPANVAFYYRPAISGVEITNDWWVDVVALFQPEEKPVVKRADDDEKAFIIDTRVRPAREFIQSGYVTGLQLAGINNKTKKRYVKYIDLEDIGKDVEFLYYDLGISTFDDDRDVSFATRWYYRDEIEKREYNSPPSGVTDYKSKGEPIEVPQEEPQDEPKETPSAPHIERDFHFVIIPYFRHDLLKMGYDSYTTFGETVLDDSDKPFCHMSVTPESFSLTIPSYTLSSKKKDRNQLLHTYTLPAISIKAKPTVKFVATDYPQYTYILKTADFTIVPSTLEFMHVITYPDGKQETLIEQCRYVGTPKGENVHINENHREVHMTLDHFVDKNGEKVSLKINCAKY